MTEEQIKELIEALKASATPAQPAPPPTPPAPEKVDLEAVKAELKADLEKSLAEILKANQPPAEPAEDSKPTEDSEPAEDSKPNDGDDKAEAMVRESINDKLKLGLSGRGIDLSEFGEVAEFIDYGKMRGEDGLADGEKIDGLVNSLASIALRQPPVKKDKPYNPSDQGLAKYLNK